jgi:hypothetical protein
MLPNVSEEKSTLVRWEVNPPCTKKTLKAGGVGKQTMQMSRAPRAHGPRWHPATSHAWRALWPASRVPSKSLGLCFECMPARPGEANTGPWVV